jgi:EAL domain-containing protein (putative c-di-GMP-specific phosphodiesterase class I)
MSVNLSGKQLGHDSLVEDVRDAVRASRIDPSSLTLEITESVMMDDTDAAIATLSELKGVGVKLAIDDFGTGYSSLRYLHDFPVDLLKVDKGFIEGLRGDAQRAAFTGSIIELCRTLRLETLAEGVEFAEQARELRRLGCELGQGNYLSVPVVADEISVLLSGGRDLEDYLLDLRGDGGARDAAWWRKALGATIAEA